MADRTDDYVALITSEHRQQPRFQEAVRALTRGFAQNTDMLAALIGQHNLDTAVGHQLDTIGLWVGITRMVPVPITGVYFTWDDTVETGWNQGQWKGLFDPDSGIVSLSDEDFRLLIRAKIGTNMWDGTTQEMSDIYEGLFGVINISVRDNVNYTYRVSYKISALTAVQKALLLNNVIKLKPVGITTIYLGY